MTDNVRALREAREPWDVAVHAIPGTRFVTPAQYREGAPAAVRRSLVKHTVIEALTRAADDDGVLLDFEFDEFFETHVAAVLAADDEPAAPLVYGRFSALALMDCITTLTIHDGLLANRGNGDSADYRLTLPVALAGG
jgi:hypothetical protein